MDGTQGMGPGEQRPGRQLAEPPSERYRAADETAEPGDDRPPTARGVVAAILAGIAGAVAIAVAGGLLTITAGLLVIAGVLGWIVAVVLTAGAGPGSGRGRRRWIAAAIALGSVATGQVGLWLVARGEGGTLGLFDYLTEVFGLLVPTELLIAATVAWWRTT